MNRWAWDQGAIIHQMVSLLGQILRFPMDAEGQKKTDPISALGAQSLVGDKPTAAGARRTDHRKLPSMGQYFLAAQR